jgi:hypothetical protein
MRMDNIEVMAPANFIEPTAHWARLEVMNLQRQSGEKADKTLPI